MKIHFFRLLLSGLLVYNAGALSDTTTNPDDQKPSGQVAGGGGVVGKQLQSAQTHHIISCYACSTMDYENPNDNACRYMPKPVHRATSLPAAVTLGHASSSSMMNYSPSTTTPPMSTLSTSSSLTQPPTSSTTSSQASSSNSMPSEVAPTSWQDSAEAGYHHNGDSDATSGAGLSSRESAQSAKNSNNSNNSASMVTPLRDSNALTYNTPSVYLPHRIQQPPPGNLIRTRTCLDDENFCSIVSVVRIEFSNDTLVSRFWAMERNCSKSCNTGCMLIGERVRLRVCSHCCRTPNCNIGNTAAQVFFIPISRMLILILTSTVAILINRASVHSDSMF